MTMGILMRPTEPAQLTSEDIDAVAWCFLRSEFTSQRYADWPIDRRLETYLLHHGPSALLNDGAPFGVLLERVMANIRPALRNGVLPSPAR
jgi:hypothetical protein